jgi:hypothetical protein
MVYDLGYYGTWLIACLPLGIGVYALVKAIIDFRRRPR